MTNQVMPKWKIDTIEAAIQSCRPGNVAPIFANWTSPTETGLELKVGGRNEWRHGR